MTKAAHFRKGFTLLELVIYMGILSAISVVLAASFSSLIKGSSIAEARAEVNANVRFAMDSISRDVMRAVSVETPNTSTPSSNLLIQAQGATGMVDVAYSNDSGRLLREETPAFEHVTSSLVVVETLSFSLIENYNSVLDATTTSIGVEIAIRHADAATPYSATLKNAIRLR
ncbi:MAG: prepilin-type N-terminal cleavage/methylation domain-containing protein [Candidatus Taylorbacteria bacterium]|nr:prepilin-type N-terminal cleavage/methylation domain-containing protein [Candidatus Taylorbacteria bacterium]